MRGLGFRPDEVVRADAVLIGHPHYDHISDTAQLAVQTAAPVVTPPLGADVLTRGGRGKDRRRRGDVVDIEARYR
jgi:L-ascorbate metabolism protein UlaG (beta-lactamase superfamily)